MPEIEILQEIPLSAAELKEQLESIKKKQPELGFRAAKTEEYLKQFSNTDAKKSKELREKLKKLEVLGLKEKFIAKICDVMPQDLDTLKSILQGETITSRAEDLKKILEALK